MNWHNEYVSILRNVGWSEYKMHKDFALTLEKHTRQNIKQAYIYEIPTEILRKYDQQDVSTQFDFNETHLNAEDNEIMYETYTSEISRQARS